MATVAIATTLYSARLSFSTCYSLVWYRAPTAGAMSVASEDYSQGLKHIYTVRTIKVVQCGEVRWQCAGLVLFST